MLFVVGASLLVAFMWASSTILHKFVLNQVTDHRIPFACGFFFYTTCMLVFWALNYKELAPEVKRLSKKAWLALAVSTVFGSFLAALLYFRVLQNNNSSIVSTLSYSSPVFVLLMSRWFLKENTHPVAMMGIGVTMIGIFLIAWSENLAKKQDLVVGDG